MCREQRYLCQAAEDCSKAKGRSSSARTFQRPIPISPGKAETKAALKSDSLSTPSRSAGRPAAAAGAASAVSSASGALAALFCADEKGAAESSSTVTVPKTVAKAGGVGR